MRVGRQARRRGKALGPSPRAVLLALLSALLSAMSVAPAVEAAGELDPTFGTGGRVLTDVSGTGGSDDAQALVIQPDGKIVVAGTSRGGDFALARYNLDGSLDFSFGAGGRVLTDDVSGTGSFDQGRALALQADGKIVVAGRSGFDFALARYNPDGSLDASFGVGGRVRTDFTGTGTFEEVANALAIQPDGKIVLAGTADEPGPPDFEFALARYNPDGSLDASFGVGGLVLTDVNGADGFDDASGLAIQPDGKIVVAGTLEVGGGSDFALARYNPDGSLDPSFGVGGRVFTDVSGTGRFTRAEALALQADGKMVVAGSSGSDFVLARYNPDGTVDAAFGVGGRVVTDVSGQANALAIQPGGQIVVAGRSGTDFALARYNPDGSLDGAFGRGGLVLTNFGRFDGASAVALQADGRIVVAGTSSFGDGPGDFALARYETAGLRVTAPAVLGLAPDRTPGAPIGAVVWSPNPFRVDAFFTNPGPGTTVSLTLDLSTAGTQLRSPDPATVVFSNVAQGQIVEAQWQVVAEAPGEARYRVRATQGSSVVEREVVMRIPELAVPPVDNQRNPGEILLLADGRFCRDTSDPCTSEFEGNAGGVPPSPFEWQGLTPTGFMAGPTGAIPVLLNDPDLDVLVYAAVDEAIAIQPTAGELDLYLMYDFLRRTTPFGPGERPTVGFDVTGGRFRGRMVVTFLCDETPQRVVVDGFDNGVAFSGRDGAALDIGGACGFGKSPNPSGDPAFDSLFNANHAMFELEVPLTQNLGGDPRPDGVYDPAPAFWTASAPGSGTLVLSQSTLSIDIMTGATTVTPREPSLAAFAALRVSALEIEGHEFEVKGTFTLGAASDGVDLLTEEVTIVVGPYAATIPAGSFHREGSRTFEFEGVINGGELEVEIRSRGHGRFDFKAEGEGVDLTGTVNPVTVRIAIGDDGGSAAVTAAFD
jgi:uncharacterized delta-60 repeat protein